MLQSKPRLVVCSTVLVIVSVLGIAAAGDSSSPIFVDKIRAYLSISGPSLHAEKGSSGNKIPTDGISHFAHSELVTQMQWVWQPEIAFTPGDVLIYRVGDGASPIGSTAAAVFLDEYTPAGALVQSVA